MICRKYFKGVKVLKIDIQTIITALVIAVISALGSSYVTVKILTERINNVQTNVDTFKTTNRNSFDEFKAANKNAFDEFKATNKNSFDEFKAVNKNSFDQFKTTNIELFNQFKTSNEASMTKLREATNNLKVMVLKERPKTSARSLTMAPSTYDVQIKNHKNNVINVGSSLKISPYSYIPISFVANRLEATICKYITNGDQKRIRSLLIANKLKIRSLYDTVLCNGKNILTIAAENNDLVAGRHIISEVSADTLIKDYIKIKRINKKMSDLMVDELAKNKVD
ncbi:MAG: hypothetical protein ACI9LM_005578 [Alteromonadaceae bacterium]|jgi:hypothetical protein